MGAIDLEHVTKQFNDGTVAIDDLTLSVEEGEFMILVGPSGCGKTTALRMIAGLEEASEGSIRIGGREVRDLPPSRRDVAMVFQNYALYPHMTVRDNIGFPLRMRKLSKSEKEEQVREVARLLAIEELLDRKPRALSGGQRQRVAMGRAIIRQPQAFLMDEPLSNLDAKLRVQMRAELLSLHRRLGITTIYVTHDQTEAMTLGDRVVVLDRGVVQQVATPERLYRRPRNTFVASFIGSPAMNFLEATLGESGLELGRHTFALPADLRASLGRDPGDVLLGVRPEDLRPVDGSATGLDAEVVITEQLGPEVLAYVRVEGVGVASSVRGATAEGDESAELRETLVARLPGDTAVRPGQRLRVAPNLAAASLFDPESGESLLTP